MASKIYTKTGDKGTTSLLGGKKVSKSDERIEAYGTVDELNSFIALLKDQEAVDVRIKHQLYWVQEKLFTVGSILATAPGFTGFKLPEITIQDVFQIEQWIDHFEKKLPPLKNFILPGGHPAVSLCHVCRTICRRAERNVSKLAKNEHSEENILPFLNRLSDYFFNLARKLGNDLNVPETPWVPG
ncbi:MAG: cob(I)yrinic acid a,c-diamide adenosyltransferase [Cyclobacteriaceae bacterium]|nr:cob(I)yrinic acid a,c-diamide adenosyltransferase [Cyclobacteriaceae bacterium]